MADIFEMVFYGRGGQGVKTASQLVADSLISEGYHIQAFPEYGPERAGAPVKSFARVSKGPIKIHCPVETADMAIIVDPTLIGSVNMVSNIKKDGILLVNSPKQPSELAKELGFKGKIYSIDASKISTDIMGRNLPNIAMLGAISRLYKPLALKFLKEQIKEKFGPKLGDLGVRKNIEVLEKAHKYAAGY